MVEKKVARCFRPLARIVMVFVTDLLEVACFATYFSHLRFSRQ